MTTFNQALVLGSTLALTVLASCGSPETPAAAGQFHAQEVAYALDTTNSVVDWQGTMLGIKSHSGTLHFTQGDLTIKDSALAAGSFTVNMRSYTFTDTNYAKPGSAQGTKANLMAHLMSPDFFAADSFPTALFTITAVNGNTATGNLTVRGRTNVETVKDINIQADGKTIKASGNLTFDRQKYGVTWKAPAKDVVLSNDIVLKIQLQGVAK